MIRISILLLLTGWLQAGFVQGQEIAIQGGHSHNDYYQQRPLFDALDNGMVSIEADVYLRHGKLLVGHNQSELKDSMSLERLYLAPLLKLFSQSKISQERLILLIDIKDHGEDTYIALKGLIQPYTAMLFSYSDGIIRSGKVMLILSGDRPFKAITEESDRYFFLDGRISDLGENRSSNLYPLISDSWWNYFKWNGDGEMPEAEKEKLNQLVSNCHEQGRLFRLWGFPSQSPQIEQVWKELKKAGVDLLGTDCLVCLEEWLGN